MKKKYIAIFIIFIILIGIILTLLFNKNNKISDQIKFKTEYESLNNTYDSNRNHDYVEVKIPEENKMKYATYDEIVSLLENGTGIIYFGFPECPWCRNAVPVLINAAEDLEINTIYYFNALSMRDEKSLDINGNIIIEKEGTEEYKKLVELMYDYLPVYKGLNDDSIKRIYFPTVVFVKNGKIVRLHKSTLETQKDPYTKLTEEQRIQLKKIYSDGINEVYDILCDDSC